MGQFGYFRIEHSSFNRDEWGYGRVANAAHYGANQNKRGHVATVGIPLYNTSYETKQAFLELEKLGTRKNARLGDSLIVSFPNEVSEPHRLMMMERFLSKITFGGRTYAQAWEHVDKPGNPHFHAVIIDRDRITGKSVGKFGHSRSWRKQHGLEPNVTEWMRKQWEDTGNEFFREHGYALSFDRRSNLERGLDAPGEHRGYSNDNHLPEVGNKVSDDLLPATEDVREGDTPMLKSDLVGVDPVGTIKFIHDTKTTLEYLHRSQEAIKDAQERYEYLVSEREKVASEAGKYQEESLPILMDSYRAQERLSEHQTETGQLKGRSIGIFGYTLFRTSARKSAEQAQIEAHNAQLEANRVEYTRKSYEQKVNQLSAQASQEERKAFAYQAELVRMFGEEQEIADAEAMMVSGIREAALVVTVGEAVTAYGEGLITEDEYRTFLLEGGYEAELQLLDEGNGMSL
ncbi:MobA/MobL family protein [Rhizobium leguminosarum]|uniref:MobA/MobL family protein n=1 Tax=Rhizobium leguminosarum TaxID=384 RepID=UPI0012FC6C90|nr:MobA/MobL family protein [Rhizobium leguminosarum]MVO95066.1 hypothetical protein [Rhizobium leguminosarum bv. phaseoli]